MAPKEDAYLVGSEVDRRGLHHHPLIASIVVAILAGLLLQLTHFIDFQERIEPSLPGSVSVRLTDVVFRMLMGALLVLVLTPAMFGYPRGAGGLRRYLTHIRVSLGTSPQKTLVATLLAVAAMVMIIALVPLVMGEFRADPGALIRDEQWIILLLALVPAIWEELAFRGAILAHLEDHPIPRRGLAISSLLFGLYHFTNLWVWDDAAGVLAGVVTATTLGLGWGYLVQRSGSVFAGVVMHYSVNVLLAAELFISPGAGDEVFGVTFLTLGVLWPVLMIGIGRALFGTTVPPREESDSVERPRPAVTRG